MRRGFVNLNGQRTLVNVDDNGNVTHNGQTITNPEWLPISIGTVYGVALNYKGLLDSRLAEFNEPPYQKPPIKPVLFIKTPNTYNNHLGNIVFPKGIERIQAGPSLGFVMAKDASRVTKEQALNYVAGFTVVNEVSLPEDSYYRPAVKAKCRDSFCPMGPWLVAMDAVNTDNLAISVSINGEIRQQNSTANLVRNIPQLIEELSEFMTLKAGDIILTGTPEGRVDINVSDKVEVTIEGIGTLTNTVIAE